MLNADGGVAKPCEPEVIDLEEPVRADSEGEAAVGHRDTDAEHVAHVAVAGGPPVGKGDVFARWQGGVGIGRTGHLRLVGCKEARHVASLGVVLHHAGRDFVRAVGQAGDRLREFDFAVVAAVPDAPDVVAVLLVAVAVGSEPCPFVMAGDRRFVSCEGPSERCGIGMVVLAGDVLETGVEDAVGGWHVEGVLLCGRSDGRLDGCQCLFDAGEGVVRPVVDGGSSLIDWQHGGDAAVVHLERLDEVLIEQQVFLIVVGEGRCVKVGGAEELPVGGVGGLVDGLSVEVAAHPVGAAVHRQFVTFVGGVATQQEGETVALFRLALHIDGLPERLGVGDADVACVVHTSDVAVLACRRGDLERPEGLTGNILLVSNEGHVVHVAGRLCAEVLSPLPVEVALGQ